MAILRLKAFGHEFIWAFWLHDAGFMLFYIANPKK